MLSTLPINAWKKLNTKRAISHLLTAASLVLISARSTACPLEKMRYQYTSSHAPGTARFVLSQGNEGSRSVGVRLHIDFARSGSKAAEAKTDHLKIDFRLGEVDEQRIGVELVGMTRDIPASDVGEYVRDVEQDMQLVSGLYAWDANHQLKTSPFTKGDKAPAFIFLPGFSSALRFIDGISAGPGMFEGKSCAK